MVVWIFLTFYSLVKAFHWFLGLRIGGRKTETVATVLFEIMIDFIYQRQEKVLMVINDNEAQAGLGDLYYYGDGVSINSFNRHSRLHRLKYLCCTLIPQFHCSPGCLQSQTKHPVNDFAVFQLPSKYFYNHPEALKPHVFW